MRGAPGDKCRECPRASDGHGGMVACTHAEDKRLCLVGVGRVIEGCVHGSRGSPSRCKPPVGTGYSGAAGALRDGGSPFADPCLGRWSTMADGSPRQPAARCVCASLAACRGPCWDAALRHRRGIAIHIHGLLLRVNAAAIDEHLEVVKVWLKGQKPVAIVIDHLLQFGILTGLKHHCLLQ